MRKPTGLEYLYLDFDSFFASAEQSFQPVLHNRPVGVLPVMSQATCVIAASKEAKPFGVKTGTPVREAKALCPDIIFVPARHEKYVELHHKIIALVDDIVPVKGVRSIDEVTCHLLSNEQERAEEIALQIKRQIKKQFGSALTCSIGLAPNELLAKIGAEMNKPDGLVTIRPEDLPRKILGLQLTDIPGIAHGNAARLKAAGIGTIAELWALAPKQMRALWGTVEGERLWAWLHGFEAERQSTERCMFGHSRVLAWNWRNGERLRICARLLTAKAARRMRREHFTARILTLNLYCKEGPGFSSDHRFTTPARDDCSILNALEAMLDAGIARLGGRRPKFVHVFLHDLVMRDARAFDLFETDLQASKRKRWEDLADIADDLGTKFHPKILHLGAYLEPPGGYAGGKIAFNRVPDKSDF
ncbi:MAG: type VI secretion protein ImpB [Pseudomonadota bacterium]